MMRLDIPSYSAARPAAQRRKPQTACMRQSQDEPARTVATLRERGRARQGGVMSCTAQAQDRVAFIMIPGTESISPLPVSAGAPWFASLPEGCRSSVIPKNLVTVLGRTSRIIPPAAAPARCCAPWSRRGRHRRCSSVPAAGMVRRGRPCGRPGETRCFFRDLLASSGHDASAANRINRACPAVDACRGPDCFGRGPSDADCGQRRTGRLCSGRGRSGGPLR